MIIADLAGTGNHRCIDHLSVDGEGVILRAVQPGRGFDERQGVPRALMRTSRGMSAGGADLSASHIMALAEDFVPGATASSRLMITAYVPDPSVSVYRSGRFAGTKSNSDGIRFMDFTGSAKRNGQGDKR